MLSSVFDPRNLLTSSLYSSMLVETTSYKLCHFILSGPVLPVLLHFFLSYMSVSLDLLIKTGVNKRHVDQLYSTLLLLTVEHFSSTWL